METVLKYKCKKFGGDILMGESKVFSVFMVIFYAILLFLVIANKNMLAMYMMAIGMLLEAIVNAFEVFKK
ncbi:hypothetical protein [Companilactobacillus insicii]|uniref:hypothetical protein n=1 Tax=Companilactobacillus insicii TaxID=1732567 RepID=UPI000F7995A4|nr:hypothetical protein [Companilactobacillus insicii]